jgi:hypothetical protein
MAGGEEALVSSLPPCLGTPFPLRLRFDRIPLLRYISCAGWSSLVARRAHNPEVVGSNPTPATIPSFKGRVQAPGLLLL